MWYIKFYNCFTHGTFYYKKKHFLKHKSWILHIIWQKLVLLVLDFVYDITVYEKQSNKTLFLIIKIKILQINQTIKIFYTLIAIN